MPFLKFIRPKKSSSRSAWFNLEFMNLSVGRPMPLGERCVDWLESEVQEWIIGKVRGELLARIFY
ncbi:AlpA family phage regulatory protein [Pseudomonas sp. WS 5086]|uniref:AlpA family phage regulatory protein n=1 Tax=Pseudomonas helleri TaxID=1608996 RepID=A0A7X1WDY4_9PSED|nr:AlpA family phage regulatory protein [Pseudomonas helleri]NMX92192.1 AlpA family phage regulatory protein [Pseudomonas sp. WS 5086]NMY46594.1 AlpA family phage regulatory protein [Pseudomonas sp. WS 5027]